MRRTCQRAVRSLSEQDNSPRVKGALGREMEATMDLKAKQTLLRMVPYGVFVVGVKSGDNVNAFLVSWLCQCSFDPPMVMMGVRKDSLSHQMIQSGRAFVINFLGKNQKDLAEKFLKPTRQVGDKLNDVAFHPGENGAPILDEAMGYLECNVTEIAQGGDHSVVIAEVTDARVQAEGELLTLADAGWHYGG